VFSYGRISLNPATHEALLDGEPVALSQREWAVLEALIARPGMILSRAQLEEKLYSWKDEISSNAVEVYVHSLRKKLGADLIRNIRGMGYMIAKEPAPASPSRDGGGDGRHTPEGDSVDDGGGDGGGD
jgi:two component transcriptional regulator, winged helix family